MTRQLRFLTITTLLTGAALCAVVTTARAGDASEDYSKDYFRQQLTPDGPPPLIERDRKPVCKAHLNELQTRDVARKIDVKINFAVNSAEITPDSKKVLDRFADAVREDKEKLSVCCFRVEGHTDQDGSEEYNLKLSQRRADAVRAYLAQKQIEVKGFKDRLIPVGRGKQNLVDEANTPEAKAKNRRVTIANLGYAE